MGLNPGSIGFAAPPRPMELVRKQRDLARVVQEQGAARSLESSSIGAGGLTVKNGGSIVVEAGGNITLVSGAFVAATVQGTTSMTTPQMNATNASVSGTVTAGGLTSLGVYALDVSTLPGGRSSVWVHVSGQIGFAPSTIAKKTDLGPVPFSAADVLAVAPYVFHYRAQLDIRDNPENPYYDPNYTPAWDIGMMAEHLIEHNLGIFVLLNEDGSARTIHYDLFGAIAALVVGRDHEERLRRLEARSGLVDLRVIV